MRDAAPVADLEAALFVSALIAQALSERIETFARENAHLRVVAQQVRCPYNHRTASGACILGYPGCACMDDLIVVLGFAPTEGTDMRAINRLVAKNHVIEQRLTNGQRRLTDGVRQFRLIADGFRREREPSKAAAIDGLADMLAAPL
jgi:hypothetical protein